MKVALIILGVLMLLAGAGCAAAGGAGAAFTGTDGWIDSGRGDVNSEGYAIVSGVADITSEDDAADVFEEFDLRLRASVESAGDGDIFIGVGPAVDVEQYLAGSSYDLVRDVDFDPLRLEKEFIPGATAPGPPGNEDFWLESVSGSGRQEIEWEIESGRYRFVIMNADGSQGVDATAEIGIKIPFLFWAGIGLAIAGAVVAVLGLIIIILAARAIGRGSRTDADAPAPQGDAEPDAPPSSNDPAHDHDTPPPVV